MWLSGGEERQPSWLNFKPDITIKTAQKQYNAIKTFFKQNLLEAIYFNLTI